MNETIECDVILTRLALPLDDDLTPTKTISGKDALRLLFHQTLSCCFCKIFFDSVKSKINHLEFAHKDEVKKRKSVNFKRKIFDSMGLKIFNLDDLEKDLTFGEIPVDDTKITLGKDCIDGKDFIELDKKQEIGQLDISDKNSPDNYQSIDKVDELSVDADASLITYDKCHQCYRAGFEICKGHGRVTVKEEPLLTLQSAELMSNRDIYQYLTELSKDDEPPIVEHQTTRTLSSASSFIYSNYTKSRSSQNSTSYQIIPAPALLYQNGTFTCGVCFANFYTKAEIQHHLNLFTRNSAQKCSYCHRYFSSADEKAIHALNCNQSYRNMMYKCNYCQKCFRNILQLNVHMDVGHRCNVCFQIFPNMYALDCHKMATGHRIRQKNCFPKSLRSIFIDGQSFKCTVCLREFKFNYRLRLHMRCHTDERPYHCDKCSQTFKHSQHLTIHDRRMHTKKFPFKCAHEGCGRSFVCQSSRKRHMLVHSDERPFACQKCPSRFKVKEHLKRHVEEHDPNNRKFVCEFCDYRFFRRHKLKQHIDRMHSGLPKKTRRRKRTEDDEEFIADNSEITTKRRLRSRRRKRNPVNQVDIESENNDDSEYEANEEELSDDNDDETLV